MISLRNAAICTLMSVVAGLIGGIGPIAGTLIVLNKSDHNAALVDPDTFKVLATLPTGRGPHEAAVSPDGRLAYVTNYGAYAVFRERSEHRMEPGNTITVLDLKDSKVKTTFDLDDYTQPHGIRVSGDGARLWVTCEGAGAVVELDAASGAVEKAWKTGQEISHMLVPTPDGRKIYVANIGSGSVTVIDRDGDAVRSIPTGDGAEGIDVTPDGREVWVTNRGAGTISVIRVQDDRLIATFDSGGTFPIRLKFTPDGRQAWVSNGRSNTLVLFDTAKRAPLATIEVGAMPVGIQMTPDGRRAFVANTNDDRVTVLDVVKAAVIDSFATGSEPDGMAWAR
jgi:YVTN family beta-propeller protein